MVRRWVVNRVALGDERGSLLAALVFSMVVVMGAGLIMFQVGRANSLRADAVTAADAAAVAGAKELRRQLYSLDYPVLDWGLICARAGEYARRNDAVVTRCEQAGLFDVRVAVSGSTSIGDLDPAKRPDGRRAVAQARARLALPVFGGGGVPVGNVNAGVADAIRLAQAMGLTVTSTTGGRHAPNSYHYRGMAADVSGSPAQMSAFYSAALARYSDIAELFYDPRGGIKHNVQIGAIGGHGGHVHIALTGSGVGPKLVEGELPEPSQGGGNAFGRPPAIQPGEVRLVAWDG